MKIPSIYTCSFAALTLMCACSSETPEQKAARELDAAIDSVMQARDFEKALSLIDTLNVRYPKEIDLRKASNLKKAKALEGISVTKIPQLDSIIVVSKVQIDSLRTLFREERPSKTLPGYLLHKDIAKIQFADRAGIQPRANMGQDALDVPWTLAVNAGRNIGLNNVNVLCTGSQSFSMSVTSEDGQMASISPESANHLGRFLNDHPSEGIQTISLQGDKGSVTVKGTAEMSRAISASWLLATTRQRLRAALVNRERYERLLQLSRDAAANAIPEQPEQK